MRTPAVCWVPLIRGGYGLALLCSPGLLLRLAGCPGDGWAHGVARLLGARHAAQAAVSAPKPSAAALALGAEADLAHALSMLGLAVVDRRRRRIGYLDATVAATFAAAGVVAARRAGAVAPPPIRAGNSLARAAQRRDMIADRVAAVTIPPPIRRGLGAADARPAGPAAGLSAGRPA